MCNVENLKLSYMNLVKKKKVTSQLKVICDKINVTQVNKNEQLYTNINYSAPE